MTTPSGGSGFNQGFIGALLGGVDPTNWLSQLGGQIASGLEAGVASLLKDIWDAIIGPLEMIAGILLAILILVWMFRDDLATVAKVAILK